MNRRIAAWTTAGALALSVGLVGVSTAAASPSRSAMPSGGRGAISLAQRAQIKTTPPISVAHKAVPRGAVQQKTLANALQVEAQAATSQAVKGKAVTVRALTNKVADRDRAPQSKAALARDRSADKHGIDQRARSATARDNR